MFNTFYLVDEKDLSDEEKNKALNLLMFLTEKRDSTMKACACADGRKQRNWTEEGTTATPKVSIDAMYMKATIEAHEE